MSKSKTIKVILFLGNLRHYKHLRLQDWRNRIHQTKKKNLTLKPAQFKKSKLFDGGLLRPKSTHQVIKAIPFS